MSSRNRDSRASVTLEKVIGNTVESNNGACFSASDSTLLYTAGATLVTFCPRRNRQTRFWKASQPQSLSCVCASKDGAFIAAGEIGRSPRVLVFGMRGEVLHELRHHKFGVRCVAINDSSTLLASVGVDHDDTLVLWDLKRGAKLASTALKTTVHSVKFHGDGKQLLTAGAKHVKYWDLQGLVEEEHASLIGVRPTRMGSHVESEMVGCEWDGDSPTSVVKYAMDTQGHLCMFNEDRQLDKWVDTQLPKGTCFAVGEKHIACGGGDGLVRLFEKGSLKYVSTLPRPPALGQADAPHALSASAALAAFGDKCPDTLAIIAMHAHKFCCIYADRSMFIWDTTNTSKVGRYRSSLAHAGCVWDLQAVPSGVINDLPDGGFLSCSADNTIRMWALPPLENANAQSQQGRRNVFSRDLVKIVYCGDHVLEEYGPPSGLRCMSLSDNMRLLASGDRQGNIRVHKLPSLEQIGFVEAHDAEVLSVGFSYPKPVLLVSGGRDRLIHVFDCEDELTSLLTLDDHSSSVTGVSFGPDRGLISTGADKSVIFRQLQEKMNRISVKGRKVAQTPFGSVFDLCMDKTRGFAVTCGQNKQIQIWDAKTAAVKRTYKSPTDSVLRVEIDPSGQYIATSGSDRTVRLMDWFTGSPLLCASGHGEHVTSVRFTQDMCRMVSASGDGCIFVWRLSAAMTKVMRKANEAAQQNPGVPSLPINMQAGRPSVGPGDVSPPAAVSERAKQAQQQRDMLQKLLQGLSRDPGVADPVNKPVDEGHDAQAQDAGDKRVPTVNQDRIVVSSMDLPPWARLKKQAEQHSPRVDEEFDDAKQAKEEGKWAKAAGTFKLFSEIGAEATVHTKDKRRGWNHGVVDSAELSPPAHRRNAWGSPNKKGLLANTVVAESLDEGESASHDITPDRAVIQDIDDADDNDGGLGVSSAGAMLDDSADADVPSPAMAPSTPPQPFVVRAKNTPSPSHGPAQNTPQSTPTPAAGSTKDPAPATMVEKSPGLPDVFKQLDAPAPASDMKSSLRASLSAKFFEQNPPLHQPEFVDNQESNDADSSDPVAQTDTIRTLKEEREELKRREMRNDDKKQKLASEVEAMRARLAAMGIVNKGNDGVRGKSKILSVQQNSSVATSKLQTRPATATSTNDRPKIEAQERPMTASTVKQSVANEELAQPVSSTQQQVNQESEELTEISEASSNASRSYEQVQAMVAAALSPKENHTEKPSRSSAVKVAGAEANSEAGFPLEYLSSSPGTSVSAKSSDLKLPLEVSSSPRATPAAGIQSPLRQAVDSPLRVAAAAHASGSLQLDVKAENGGTESEDAAFSSADSEMLDAALFPFGAPSQKDLLDAARKTAENAPTPTSARAKAVSEGMFGHVVDAEPQESGSASKSTADNGQIALTMAVKGPLPSTQLAPAWARKRVDGAVESSRAAEDATAATILQVTQEDDGASSADEDHSHSVTSPPMHHSGTPAHGQAPPEVEVPSLLPGVSPSKASPAMSRTAVSKQLAASVAKLKVDTEDCIQLLQRASVAEGTQSDLALGSNDPGVASARSALLQLHTQISQVLKLPTNSNTSVDVSQSVDMNSALAKYSDMLVELVQKKLQS